MSSLDDLIMKFRTRDPKVALRLNQDKSAISMLRGNLSAPVNVPELRNAPYEHARLFIRENKPIVGEINEANELIDEKTVTNRRGMTHVVFQQKHGNALVVGGTLSVHYGADGGIHLVKSNLASAIDVPKEPEIPADCAVEIAKQHAGEGSSLSPDTNPVLEVVDAKTLHLDDKPQRYYLCWKIRINLPPESQEIDSFYLVDALNGEIHLVYPAIQTGTGTGYYSQGTALNSERSENHYRLRDSVTSSQWSVATKPVIHTYDDMGEKKLYPVSSIMGIDLNTLLYSKDDNDNWDNGGVIPSNRTDDQREEVDIHRFMGYVLSYYYLTHGHNGWNGKGADSRCHAHNECSRNNAFYDGSIHQMYFASGDGRLYDFMCTLDIVGHEFTHAVNHGFNILKFYTGETGALNEAIADLFGALISLQHPADVPHPWMYGSQCDLIYHRGRSMSDPSRDAHGVVKYDTTNESTKYGSYPYYPDHYSISYNPPQPWINKNDYGGVHINAPIITHAVYLMINGGTHRLSNVSVTGIGVAPVEEILYETISSGLLRETSRFADFSLAFNIACQNLYPENHDYLATVKTAFHAIGLESDVAGFRWIVDSDRKTVKFFDESINWPTSWYWKFGDGATSTEQNPTHTYAVFGKYKVNLTVWAPSGSDEVTNYIHLVSPIASFTDRYTDSTKMTFHFIDKSISEYSPIISWLWKFGDGTTSTEQNPTHTYKRTQRYFVTLTVTTRDAGSDKTTSDVWAGRIEP